MARLDTAVAPSGGAAVPRGRRCLRGAGRTPRSLPVSSAGCECPHGDSSCGAVRGAHRDPPRRRGREQASAPSPALGAHFASARGVGRARGAEARAPSDEASQGPASPEGGGGAGAGTPPPLPCSVGESSRARPVVGGPSPPELVSPSRGARHAPFADDAALLPCPRACPRRLWRVPSCLRLAGERARRFPVRAAAVMVTPGSGVGPRGRKSVPAGPALRAPTTQSPRSSV